jgi:hypothetical protein
MLLFRSDKMRVSIAHSDYKNQLDIERLVI